MKKILVATAAVIALLVAAPAWAADATLFGSAVQEPTDVKITSLGTTQSGGVEIPVPAGLTFSTITSLSAEFNVTDDDCGGGSPRFDITLANAQTVGVTFGPSPNFTGCLQNTWLSTGNLIGNNDAGRYEIRPGTPFITYAQALALVGSQQVTKIALVVDGGWKQADSEQTVLVRNVVLNGQTFTLAAPTGGGGGGTLNPAQLCKAERTKMGSAAAFNELWGTNANSRNAFGKCVSTIAHARNAGKTQEQILAAIESCKAQGKKGADLGACVAATDGVAATKTEAQEKAAASHGKKKGKKK